MKSHHARIVAAAAFLLSLILGTTPAGAMGTQGDPLQAKQWSLRQIGASTAWATSTGKGVTIGVVDTGVDLTHEDLAEKVATTATCIGAKGDPKKCQEGGGQDDNGHGSHVSGIATAVTGNGKGIAGVAPDAKLVVAKVLGSDGSGASDDINAGIEWVVDHGAQVVNLSLAGNFVITNVLGSPLSDGIEYAWNKGAIPVLAAGNDKTLVLGASQNYGTLHAVVVGATGPTDKVASYSSDLGNAQWGMVAPGGDGAEDADHQILSTLWSSTAKNTYGLEEGTSMAAPHVTGALADLRAMGYSQSDAVQRVLATANTAVACGSGCHGRLDLAKAVGPPPASGSSPTTTTAGGGSAAATGSTSGTTVASSPSGPSTAGPGSKSSGGVAAAKTSKTTVKAVGNGVPSNASVTSAPAADAQVQAGDVTSGSTDVAAPSLTPTGPASSGHGKSRSYVVPAIVAAALVLGIVWAMAAMPGNRRGVRAGEER